jgi:hypothetical protein
VTHHDVAVNNFSYEPSLLRCMIIGKGYRSPRKDGMALGTIFVAPGGGPPSVMAYLF